MLNCSYIFYKDVVWSRKASNFLRLINDLHPTWTVKQHSEFRCSEISILIFFSPIPKYCTASSTVSIYFSQIGILPFSILIATLLSSFSLWTKHFYLPMTIYNFIYCHRQIKLQYRWQFSTLPHRFCTVIKYDQIFSGSIIITDMLRRPVQLLHILSNSSRSIPLRQCYISAFPRIYSINRADISWRIYLVALHIFTSCM